MHSTQLLALGVAVLGCALGLAACGGSANYNPAAATNPNTNSPLLLSQCMHSHGIRNFRDPTNGPGGTGFSLATGVRLAGDPRMSGATMTTTLIALAWGQPSIAGVRARCGRVPGA